MRMSGLTSGITLTGVASSVGARNEGPGKENFVGIVYNPVTNELIGNSEAKLVRTSAGIRGIIHIDGDRLPIHGDEEAGNIKQPRESARLHEITDATERNDNIGIYSIDTSESGIGMNGAKGKVASIENGSVSGIVRDRRELSARTESSAKAFILKKKTPETKSQIREKIIENNKGGGD